MVHLTRPTQERERQLAKTREINEALLAFARMLDSMSLPVGFY